MLKGFRDFIARGNVVELAVAFVVGAAFAALVNSLVADLFTPLIAAIIGEPSFAGLSLTINGSELRYGEFLNSVLAFASVAVAIYFFVVAPMNAWTARRTAGADPTIRDCPQCLTEIPAKATRCAHCTSEVVPAAS